MPRKYLKELQQQLPKDDQGTYNVPDGWTFEVPASELDDPRDEQIPQKLTRKP